MSAPFISSPLKIVFLNASEPIQMPASSISNFGMRKTNGQLIGLDLLFVAGNARRKKSIENTHTHIVLTRAHWLITIYSMRQVREKERKKDLSGARKKKQKKKKQIIIRE